MTILISEFFQDNNVYRKNRVYHDDGNGKYNKSVISDFRFLNFRHRDFSIQSTPYFIFWKIPKTGNFNKLGRQIAGTLLTPRLKLTGGKRSSVRVLQS